MRNKIKAGKNECYERKNNYKVEQNKEEILKKVEKKDIKSE